MDRGREVLNEAIAKEVERNVRRREEVGSAAGEFDNTTGVERKTCRSRLPHTREKDVQ